MSDKKFDFSGWATKNDLKCTDGRTIRKDAFKENDGTRVPLVWQHLHNEPENILGHAILENRADGVYAYGVFNDSPSGKNAKTLVEHGDITAMSIYANQLVEKSSIVHGGRIREVSLVLSGANPGAVIENLSFSHGDGSSDRSDDEALIYTDQSLVLSEIAHEETPDSSSDMKAASEEKEGDSMAQADNADKTVGDVFNTLNEEQKTVVYAMIAEALGEGTGGAMQQSDGDDTNMKKNLFDSETQEGEGKTLSHDALNEIMQAARDGGSSSLKKEFLAHTVDYGIENIGLLFPDAQTLNAEPDFIQRDTSWVGVFMNASQHRPFSRIKTVHADITADAARALGYVKATLKKEEVITLLQRITTPTTIYKKQKLDRDDIVDITDFNVVAWLKSEMRVMLDEEIARAALISDGREVGDADKINETNIRPIWKDNDMYAHRVSLADTVDTAGIIEAMIRARENYKGSGNPILFTTASFLTDMLLLKDGVQRRLYSTQAELESALRVSKIVEVEVMNGVTRETTDVIPLTYALKGIIVNPRDYVFGADKGGEIGLFDDFDIDYNQYKYLMESRLSGALVKPKSALIIEQLTDAG
jgi:hypothetical protein